MGLMYGDHSLVDRFVRLTESYRYCMGSAGASDAIEACAESPVTFLVEFMTFKGVDEAVANRCDREILIERTVGTPVGRNDRKLKLMISPEL